MRTILALGMSALLLVTSAVAADPVPRAVLLLDQSEPNAPWGLEFRAALRSALSENTTQPIAQYSEVLDLARFNSPRYEAMLRSSLREKYRDIPIGVIIAHGSNALEILLRLRDDLWPKVPVVFALVDQTAAAQTTIPANVTGRTVQLTFGNAVAMARVLVPGLKRMALVGDPFERQPFRRHFPSEMAQFAGELQFIDLLGLPMNEVLRRVSSLPDDAAIYYTALTVDGAGSIFISREALSIVAKAANRPIVSDTETHVGHGGAGGMVAVPEPVGREAAGLALRILNGENPKDIPVALGDYVRPIFDWRELRRWNVREASLPAGSEVRFRSLSLWDQYRWQMLGILAVVLFQASLIAAMLIERRRRVAAERQSRRRLVEMAQMDRALTVGVMSTSIAHELNQPLGAILNNAATASILLENNPPDINQLKEILVDIRRDDERAGAIVNRLRGFLRKGDFAPADVDVNDVLREVQHLVETEATRSGVVVVADPQAPNSDVRMDRVLLQQVLINLAMNGMDSMKQVPSDRRLTLHTSLASDSEIEVSVSDTGVGFPENSLRDVFELFVTTKQQGTGLGLAIARTIVENFGGKIWAENRLGGGAVVRFVLPLARTSPA